LTELIRKDVQFKWKGRKQAAFDRLKKVLCSEQVLAYPYVELQFILTTDASRFAVAAILPQVQDGKERPVAFGSRQLNKAEQNYSASESEMLPVTWATKHLSVIFTGRNLSQQKNQQYASRLEKCTLTTAYRLVRENSRKAHATNKRYYDRKAREEF
jgi:hypothetical protein